MDNFSAHSVFVIFVGEISQQYWIAGFWLPPDGGMLYAVEHICLDSGIVVHVEQGEAVAWTEGFGELPVACEISAQT